MKLATITQVSVDGVAQGNGGTAENVDGVFERGGWATPYFDDEALQHVIATCEAADAFLYGRWTYDLFAGYWGAMAPGSHPIADAFNTRPKHLVSSSPAIDPRWPDTTVLSGDVVAAIRELKARPGGELQVHGSLGVVRLLLEHDLVDELRLLVAPVIVGQGTRLFPATGPDVALDLVGSRTFPKGITAQTYRPAGRPAYATAS